MHRGEGGLAMAVEARRRICRDHEREDSTVLGGVARGRGGHARNTENGEKSTAVTCHSVLLGSGGAKRFESQVVPRAQAWRILDVNRSHSMGKAALLMRCVRSTACYRKGARTPTCSPPCPQCVTALVSALAEPLSARHLTPR